MPKRDATYHSVLDHANNHRLPFVRKIQAALYPEEYKKWEKEKTSLEARMNKLYRKPKSYSKKQQFLGGFQPLINIKNEIVDTVKPYKSSYHFWKDAAQPSRGVGNVLAGLGKIGAIPALAIADMINYQRIYKTGRYGYRYGNEGYENGKNLWITGLKATGVRSLSWLVSGASSVGYGVLQVLTTPAVPFKIGFRLIRTAISGRPKAENNKNIKNILNNETVPYPNLVLNNREECKFLHRRYKSSIDRGQKTDVTFLAEEKRLWGLIKDEEYGPHLQYIGLFQKANKSSKKHGNDTENLIINRASDSPPISHN